MDKYRNLNQVIRCLKNLLFRYDIYDIFTYLKYIVAYLPLRTLFAPIACMLQ